MSKIVGDNHEGFANERQIIDYINSKVSFANMNSNFKMFLSFIFEEDCTGFNFSASSGRGGTKPDVIINNGKKIRYVSVKTGSGNSVHQEKIDVFKSFLFSNGMPSKIVEDLLYFHFGDGTKDGTGKVRISSKKYKTMHGNSIFNINEAFNNSKAFLQKAIERFLFIGSNITNIPAEFVYHGTINNGKWASKNEILRYFLSTNKAGNDTVRFSHLCYQVWNRNLKFNPKTEDRRFVMQIKWPTLYSDLETITENRTPTAYTTANVEGDLGEISAIELFNRRKHSSIFSNYFLKLKIQDLSNIYLVRVSTKQYSSLSEMKVMTRADAYAIYSTDSNINEIVHRNNGWIDEDILASNNIIFKKIDYSGISIKKTDSTNYQILKLTVDSFYKLFRSYELGAGASLYCEKELELIKNVDVINGWKSNIKSMKDTFNVSNDSKDFYLNKEICMKIKSASIKSIESLIKNNEEIKKKVFNGHLLYSEPYTAWHLMQGNLLFELNEIPFSITTGSGRSKGIYSIVLKPR